MLEEVKKSFVQSSASRLPSDLFFSIGTNRNLGYSNQANTLAYRLAEAEGQGKQAEKIDLEAVGVDGLLEILKRKSNIKKITLVSSAGYGLDFFNTFARKLEENKIPIAVEYQYTTDRFFNAPIELYDNQWIQNLYITSIDGIDEFNLIFASCKNQPKILKTDLVQVDLEGILRQSEDFKTKNPNVCGKIEKFEGLEKGIAFIGGRVQNPDGSWIENNPEVFADIAKYLMSQGVRVFATHGLRSFTNSDKTNDFSPIEAFYQVVKGELGIGEFAYIFTQQETDKTTREPILKKITKQQDREIIENDININGNSYNYLLCLAAGRDLSIYPTIEQTTLPSEAVSINANPTKIIPLNKEKGWDLYIDSNIKAYEYFLKNERLEKPLMPFNAVMQSKEQVLSSHSRQ